MIVTVPSTASASSRGVLTALRAAAIVVVATGLNDVLVGALPRYEPLYIWLAAIALVVFLDGIILGIAAAILAMGFHALLYLPRATLLDALPLPIGASVATILVATALRAIFRSRRRAQPAVEVFPPSPPLLPPIPAMPADNGEVLDAIDELRVELRAAVQESALAREREEMLERTFLEAREALVTRLRIAEEEARANDVELRRQLDAERAAFEVARNEALSLAAEETSLEKRIAALNDEAEAERNRALKLSAEIAAERERSARDRSSVETARSEIEKLQRMLTSERSTHAALDASVKREVEELRASLEASRTIAEVAEREATQLRDALEAEKTVRVASERTLASEHAREVEGLRAAIAAGEASARALASESAGELAELRTTLSEVRASHERVDREVNELRASLETSRADAGRDAEALRSALSEARATHERVEREANELRQAHDAVTHELSELRAKHDGVEREATALRASLDTARVDAGRDADELRTTLHEARASNERAEREASELRQAHADVKRELSELRAKHEGVEREANDLRASLETSREDAGRDADELRATLNEARAKHERVEREASELRTAHADVTRALSELRAKHEAVEREANDLREALREASELRATHGDATRELQDLRVKHEDVDRALSEAQRELEVQRERASQDIQLLESRLAELDALRASAENLLTASRAEFDEKLNTIVTHLAQDHEQDMGKAVLEREEARAEARAATAKLSKVQQRVEEDQQAILAKLREADERHKIAIGDANQLLAETRQAAQKEIERLQLRIAQLEAVATPRRGRVLIAHPDPDMRATARASLERAGYEIVSAGDGLEALRTAIAQNPDVVIADAVMPKMNGRELCQLLKSQEKTAHIRVILLTRASDDMPKGDIPPDLLLRKPVPLETLKSTLAEMVPRS